MLKIKKWIIDDEAAEIVRRIFNMRLQGESVNKIAEKLKRKNTYSICLCCEKRHKKAAKKVPLGEFIWSCERVRMILTNQSYVGDVINFKTYLKSFKLKKRLENAKENWKIHKNVHEPIIDRADFEKV